ncbi:protein-export membrane protein, SecD/SecF family [Synechococcus sp. PCC 7502]|uniref:protein translocase subunit SecF n=1 Tax=Synechococcus sp. PCC 7502 TaxID=1173263 RepID=UPI00029FAB43|nr:protein translocase subunit SecF [Synechococcus sp. PCC 7502]AFY74886.1 protein-export membrane protein, SecD/SecF family [Synechococcus sp. PCC 7502]
MKLDVIKYGKVYVAASVSAILIGIVAMLISWQTLGFPLRPAIDFTGGTRLSMELVCDSNTQIKSCGQPIDIGLVRSAIAEKGYAKATIQLLGEDGRGLSLQTGDLEVNERSQLQGDLESILDRFGKIDPSKSQIQRVGPTIGNQLLTSGLLALVLSFVGIAVYLGFRFQLDYAVFAIVALLHDVLVTSGVFAILGLTIGLEVDSLFIVAMLTIIGFSVNDTVIIYDRIRENMKIWGEDYSFGDLVNLSVNQTLARSINTTLTALLSLVAIFLFGGVTLKFFALALIIGFSSGAYSSIFNASILLAWWRNRKSA